MNLVYRWVFLAACFSENLKIHLSESARASVVRAERGSNPPRAEQGPKPLGLAHLSGEAQSFLPVHMKQLMPIPGRAQTC